MPGGRLRGPKHALELVGVIDGAAVVVPLAERAADAGDRPPSLLAEAEDLLLVEGGGALGPVDLGVDDAQCAAAERLDQGAFDVADQGALGGLGAGDPAPDAPHDRLHDVVAGGGGGRGG